LIIAINYVIREAIIKGINWVGEKTETSKLSYITNFTFYAQFFNTGFLLLLANANFGEQPILKKIDGGSMGDYNEQWFLIIGNAIVSTMIINAFFPLVEFAIFWFMRWFARYQDSGVILQWKITEEQKYNTKTKMVQQYLDTWCGPAYEMHFKYAGIMNIVFITLMYGVGLPILYPIAVLALIILYISEKYMLYYAYQVPPMYDEKLS